MKKRKAFLLFLAGFLLIFQFQSFAFEDVTDSEEAKMVSDLQGKGIISGIDAKRFAPERPLTYAEAGALLVKAFSLTMPDYKWIKKPKASDMYTKVPDNAWYAKPLMILFYHQLSFPWNINPQDPITREEFAYYLHQILVKTKNPVTIEMWADYADQDQVKKEYQNAINDLINLKVATLDEKNQFRPKEPIKRIEAAIYVYRALQIPDEKGGEPMPPFPQKPEPVQVLKESVGEDVYKVTLSWGEKPNPGYRITINRIEFVDNTAFIYYSLHYPDPNKFYPQVITEAKASTFISKAYEIKAIQEGTAKASSRPIPYPMPPGKEK